MYSMYILVKTFQILLSSYFSIVLFCINVHFNHIVDLLAKKA